MANILSTDKQIAVISSLAEGSSIRSIERITGVHRERIMRLGVRLGRMRRMNLRIPKRTCYGPAYGSYCIGGRSGQSGNKYQEFRSLEQTEEN